MGALRSADKPIKWSDSSPAWRYPHNDDFGACTEGVGCNEVNAKGGRRCNTSAYLKAAPLTFPSTPNPRAGPIPHRMLSAQMLGAYPAAGVTRALSTRNPSQPEGPVGSLEVAFCFFFLSVP